MISKYCLYIFTSIRFVGKVFCLVWGLVWWSDNMPRRFDRIVKSWSEPGSSDSTPPGKTSNLGYENCLDLNTLDMKLFYYKYVGYENYLYTNCIFLNKWTGLFIRTGSLLVITCYRRFSKLELFTFGHK